jgi:hypothetical protein
MISVFLCVPAKGPATPKPPGRSGNGFQLRLSLVASRELALKVSKVVIRRNIVVRIRFARQRGIMLPAFDQGEAKPKAYLDVFIVRKKLKND